MSAMTMMHRLTAALGGLTLALGGLLVTAPGAHADVNDCLKFLESNGYNDRQKTVLACESAAEKDGSLAECTSVLAANFYVPYDRERTLACLTAKK